MTPSSRRGPELPFAPFRLERLTPDARTAAVAVWVQGKMVGRVHEGAPPRLGLVPGAEVSAEAADALLAALCARAAYESGLRRLARQAVARGQLERRLAEVWGPDAARDAVAHLSPYLDDAAFARAWVERRLASRPMGAPALLAGLCGRGVAEDVARPAIAEAIGDEDAFGLCQVAARRYLARCDDPSPARRRARLWAHLARRGFDADTAERVLARLGADGEW